MGTENTNASNSTVGKLRTTDAWAQDNHLFHKSLWHHQHLLLHKNDQQTIPSSIWQRAAELSW
jgi:hypothetical protein